MKTKIKELYDGDIRELRGYPAKREEQELWSKVHEQSEKIAQRIGKDGAKLLEEYDDAVSDLCSFIREDGFADGFIVGVQLMSDVYRK